MNTRLVSTRLATVACLMLASCAIKDPPAGANIHPEAARSKIPGSVERRHRSGEVVPNWIRTFGDPELTRSSRTPSRETPISPRQQRASKPRAPRCESPHRRSIRASR